MWPFKETVSIVIIFGAIYASLGIVLTGMAAGSLRQIIIGIACLIGIPYTVARIL